MIEDKMVIELWKLGYSAGVIAKELDAPVCKIRNAIDRLARTGSIQRRKSTVKMDKCMKNTSHDELISNMYKNNALLEDIAAEVGLSKSYVSLRINELRKEGKLEKRKRVDVQKKKDPIEKTEKYTEEVKNKNFTILDTPVRTNTGICGSCIYGTTAPKYESGMCRFMACTGVPRIKVMPLEESGCPMYRRHCLCNVYEKVSRDNPRRKNIIDDTHVVGLGTLLPSPSPYTKTKTFTTESCGMDMITDYD